MICRFSFGPAFFLPDALRPLGDAFVRQDRIRLAPRNPDPRRVAMSARILRQGVIHRFGSGRRRRRRMTSTRDGVATVIRRTKEKPPAAGKAIEAHTQNTRPARRSAVRSRARATRARSHHVTRTPPNAPRPKEGNPNTSAYFSSVTLSIRPKIAQCEFTAYSAARFTKA